jgi:hypothetical protein
MDGDAVAAAAAVESGRRRLQTIHNHLHSPPSGEGSAQLEKQPTAAEFYLGFLSCLKPYFILFLLEVFGHIIIKIFYGKN